ncbi:hypothetical protein BOKEGFJH_00663 [Chlamydia avium]|uniref:Secretory of YscJ/FliF family protein n=2 Tax=Chlamydia avium TaxID=1457141 RepID=W8JML5_9CHLA|nr:secretory of YscJ/FliF family protein [Chlamydia avium]AHK63539.1 Secretory of YscJ/FliF family protein [Chlamydia avium 10DC88]EPP36121.1 secretory of YscJ/FliF family protein [Chlamydia psittaci 10_743_SC13]EPP38640.1 secretory of YscJ/FliF family protein [Chlamydia avium]VVT43129.1 hypothetical protein BOKEGFJH_00663 [Chlamydia avium]
MLFQFLKKKCVSLGVSPLSLLAILSILSCAFFLNKTSSSSTPTTKLTPEKKSSMWFQFSQVGNLKFLESLAKKEQIEKDLTTFQSIASATVALSLPSEEDILTPKQISVILTPHKNEQLSPSLLLSIIDYLLSSFPGLKKENITLSDTLGNTYSPGEIAPSSLLLATCKGYLEKIFPKEHFALTYVRTKQHPTIQLTINEKYLEKLSKEVKNNLLIHTEENMKKICGDLCSITIELFPFSPNTTKKSPLHTILIGILILFSSLGIIALASFYLAFYAYEKIPAESKKIKQGINITKLVEVLQKESPEKIGLILSYLDPKKANELLNKLPEDIKNKIMKLYKY